jgi:putative ABC transport system permease protein
VHARGTAPLPVLLDRVKAQIAALDPDLPIVHASPMGDLQRAGTVILEFMSAILFVFGTAGMALAGLGIYGMVSYTVKQRTREIGIRMALGAPTLAVVRELVGGALRLGAIGAAVGVVVAVGVSRLLTGVLVGVSSVDAISYARALAIVFAGVLAATAIPAWRASRTNPLSALRHH